MLQPIKHNQSTIANQQAVAVSVCVCVCVCVRAETDSEFTIWIF